MSRTTFFQARYIDWPPVAISSYADPDSCHWQKLADLAVAEFDRLASEFWTKAGWEWFNRMVVDCHGDAMTWKQAYQIYQQAAENLAEGVTVEALAWECGILPEQPESAGGLRANIQSS